MFESIAGQVVLPHLSTASTRQLFDLVTSRLHDHLAGQSIEPLIVLAPNTPSHQLRALSRRLESAEGLRGADVILATSGSGGDQPHLVKLSWASLIASATATTRFLGARGTWVLSLPAHHIAGFQIIVRSALNGIYPLTLHGVDLDSLTALTSNGPDRRLFISLVPTQIARLASAPNGASVLGEFDRVLVGGAHLPPSLAAQCPPNLVTTYGMTETCGGCVYDGLPLQGVHVRVVEGEILLGGATLLTGYVDEPTPVIEVDGEKWLRTNDRGQLTNGKLDLLGRADDMIISGGENISAVAIANVITSEFPQLDDVHVVGWPDAEWGHAVCVAISGDGQSASVIGPQIERLVRQKLGNHFVPRHIVSFRRFPLLPNGKVDRRALFATIGRKIGGKEARDR